MGLGAPRAFLNRKVLRRLSPCARRVHENSKGGGAGEGGTLTLVSVSAETLLWFNWELSIEQRPPRWFSVVLPQDRGCYRPINAYFNHSLRVSKARSFLSFFAPLAAQSLGDILRKTSGA